MSIEVRDGWLFGTLPDHTGAEIPIVRFPRNDMKPWSRLALDKPHPCLHTTEGGPVLGERYKFWDFPPQFACGDFKIVQLFPLWAAGEAVDTKDAFLMQIELADRVADHPPNKVRLPVASTLNPLVALAAFLHRRELVSTFLRRPNLDWPVALDRLPAATDDYYRRTDGTWPKPGVYGHVEMPDDEHWDPGSFDYPAFFALVRNVIDDMGYAEFEQGLRDKRQGKPKQPDAPGDYLLGYAVASDIAQAAKTPEPAAHAHDDLSKKAHVHGPAVEP